MSHQPERKEKNCLNCGATVIGRYCHVCGQENVETKESFWSLIKHFVFDIFHFDGNFFYTLKYIFTRPGQVARKYCEGKRQSYLHPIRMYLFTSAVFFLVFFSMKSQNGLDVTTPMTMEQRKDKLESYQAALKQKPEDSIKYLHRISLLKDTSKPLTYSELYEGDTTININGRNYSSVRQYDSIQNVLPPSEKDGWLIRAISKRTIELSKKHHNDSIEMVEAVWETFLHRMPYMLFISLPFFALVLRLLYIRHRNFYYSDHAVFTLYHYIFSFLLLLLIFGVDVLNKWLQWKILDYFIVALFLTWPVYLWIEMKRFYGQGVAKTLGKFVLLNLSGVLILILLTILFFLFSIFQM